MPCFALDGKLLMDGPGALLPAASADRGIILARFSL